MAKLKNVWVVGENSDRIASLAALAVELGESVGSLMVPEHGESGVAEDGTAAIAAAVKERAPEAVLFPTTKRMRLLAAFVAAACGTRAINDASSVYLDGEGRVCADHLVFGGGAIRTERVASGPAIILVSDALLASAALADVAPVPVEISEEKASSGLTLKERRAREVESVNLSAARRVVSVGRGFEKEEDLELAFALARALEAEVGCTRPIAEGSRWMSRERYIGVSGALLKPDLFVAVGLSGQVQHMVGAESAKTIVAINKDKNAPIFKQVDYGMVGDLYEVLPKLTAALQA